MQVTFDDWLRHYQQVCVAYGQMQADQALAARQHVQETGGLRLEIRKLECRVEELTAELNTAREQLAQVTAERNDLKKLSTQINPALLHELVNAFEGCDPATIRQKLLALDGKGFQLSQEVGELPGYPQPECANCGSNMHRKGTGWKCHTCKTEWSGGVIDFVRQNLAEPAPEPYQWQVGDELERDGKVVEIQDVQDGRFYLSNGDSWPTQILMIAIGYTLHRKASDPPPGPQLPAEPAPEPYQWQVGDVVAFFGVTPRKVTGRPEGWVSLEGAETVLPQSDWESRGWRLYCKASDQPDIPPPSPQQVAEPISDSTGADGEGRS
jgi:hypothetical protein